MVKQEFRNVVMALTSGNSLSGKLPNPTAETYVCTRRYQGADDRQEATACGQSQRGIKRLIMIVNVGIRLCSEQSLNCGGMSTSHGIHERCVALR